jgi:hypothetical protein
MRSAKVPLSPSSALQTMYFCGPGVLATVFHLIPAGNPAPPRPRRPEAVTSSRICAAADLARAAQAGPAAGRLVVLEAGRAGLAGAAEGQALLAGDERMLGGLADALVARAVEDRVDIAERRRPNALPSISTSGSSQCMPQLLTRWTSWPFFAKASASSSARARGRGRQSEIRTIIGRSRSRGRGPGVKPRMEPVADRALGPALHRPRQ